MTDVTKVKPVDVRSPIERGERVTELKTRKVTVIVVTQTIGLRTGKTETPEY